MKSFDEWNKNKKQIEVRDRKLPIFHNSEIWWCSLGLNIGYEEDGKGKLFERPVFVYKKFNNSMFLGIPMTTKYKDNPFYFKLNENENSTLILSQIKLMSSKRLLRSISKVSRGKYKELKSKLLEIL